MKSNLKAKTRGLLAILMGLSILAMSACTGEQSPSSTDGEEASSSESQEEASEPTELKKIVIAEPVHLTGYLPLYVAQHEGYFEEQGLDVEVIMATGGTHVSAVVSGDAWGVIGGVDSNALANKNNSDPIVSVVNVVNRANVYLFATAGTAPESDSAEDLKAFVEGKNIIAGRHGGSPNLLTRYFLINLGLDPDADVTLQEPADASTVVAMMQSGNGDIGNGAEPQVAQGMAEGVWDEPFYKFHDLGDFSYSVLSVKQSTIDEDPETVQKFVNAIVKALAAVQEDKDLAERNLVTEFPTLTEEGKQAALDRAYEDELWSVDGYITETAVENNMNVLIQTGMFEGDYSYDELIDMQFVDNAE